jgi:hypothetical protein
MEHGLSDNSLTEEPPLEWGGLRQPTGAGWDMVYHSILRWQSDGNRMGAPEDIPLN